MPDKEGAETRRDGFSRAILAVKLGSAIAASFILLYLAMRFMLFSLASLARDVPYVMAGLMSAFFALLTLSGALILLRDVVLYRKALEQEESAE